MRWHHVFKRSAVAFSLTLLASAGAALVGAPAYAVDGEADAVANASADAVPVNDFTPPGVVDNPDTWTASAIVGPEYDLVIQDVNATTNGVVSNPYGCYGQTDYPHLSSTPGYVNVHARTRCSVSLGYIEAYTALYRGRWYGPQFLNDGDSNRQFSNYSGDAVAPWHCKGAGTYTYEGDSAHEVDDGSQQYYAYTSQHKRLTC